MPHKDKAIRKEYLHKWYLDHKAEMIKRSSEYKKNNRNVAKRHYEKHKDQICKRVELYRKSHKNEIIEYQRKWIKSKRQNDINYHLLSVLRHRVYISLKKNSKSKKTIELIGCSIEFLKGYLEAQFKEGMNWNNYGKWHIDHIKPCALFDMTIEKQQKACFHYSNLQPLWAIENIKKGVKYA